MAIQLNEQEDLSDLKRELREALQQCDLLVERTRKLLLRHSGQDNDPRCPSQST
jgi:hypothetical protein